MGELGGDVDGVVSLFHPGESGGEVAGVGFAADLAFEHGEVECFVGDEEGCDAAGGHGEGALGVALVVGPLAGGELAGEPVVLDGVPVGVGDFDADLGAGPDAEDAVLGVGVVPGESEVELDVGNLVIAGTRGGGADVAAAWGGGAGLVGNFGANVIGAGGVGAWGGGFPPGDGGAGPVGDVRARRGADVVRVHRLDEIRVQGLDVVGILRGVVVGGRVVEVSVFARAGSADAGGRLHEIFAPGDRGCRQRGVRRGQGWRAQ